VLVITRIPRLCKCVKEFVGGRRQDAFKKESLGMIVGNRSSVKSASTSADKKGTEDPDEMQRN